VICRSVSICFIGNLPVVELLFVVCTEVDEGGVQHDHLLPAMHHIGEVVGQPVAHGEVAVDVVISEVLVLEHLTASIQAKNVSEVLWIVIPCETMAG